MFPHVKCANPQAPQKRSRRHIDYATSPANKKNFLTKWATDAAAAPSRTWFELYTSSTSSYYSTAVGSDKVGLVLNADGSAMIASAACGPINTDYTFQGAKYSYGDTDDNCNMGGDALIYKMNAAGTPV